MSRRPPNPMPSACIRSTSSCSRFRMLRSRKISTAISASTSARWQRACDQDIWPRAPLGFGGRRHKPRRCTIFHSAVMPKTSAPQSAHRRQRRRTDRPAARLRKQRFLVPQPRRRVDRSESRAEGVARPEIRQPMDRRAGRASPAPASRQSAAGASAPAVACADLYRAMSMRRSSSTSARSACVCPTAPPISWRSCTASTAAIIICSRW